MSKTDCGRYFDRHQCTLRDLRNFSVCLLLSTVPGKPRSNQNSNSPFFSSMRGFQAKFQLPTLSCICLSIFFFHRFAPSLQSVGGATNSYKSRGKATSRSRHWCIDSHCKKQIISTKCVWVFFKNSIFFFEFFSFCARICPRKFRRQPGRAAAGRRHLPGASPHPVQGGKRVRIPPPSQALVVGRTAIVKRRRQSRTLPSPPTRHHRPRRSTRMNRAQRYSPSTSR
jgi:hypothetical protein